MVVAAGALAVHLIDIAAAFGNWTSTAGVATGVTADFNSWMASGRILFAGGSPYLPFPPVHGGGDSVAGAVHQPYPPTFFLAMAPWIFTGGPLRYLSWMAVQELALVVVVVSVWSGIGRPARTEAAVAMSLVLPFLPVRQNLFEGQANLVTAALAAVAVLAWQRRRALPGGLALALAVALKPTVAFAALFLAYRQAWRLLAWAATAGVALVAVTVALGWGGRWAPFLGLLGPLGRGSAFIANQSFNGVLLRAWRPDLAGEPIGALPPGFLVAWYGLEGAVAAALVVGLRRLPLAEPELTWVQFGAGGVLFALLQPLSWFHHQAGAVVLVVVLVRLAARGRLGAGAITALLVSWGLVSLVAYPVHLAARPYGGDGLYGQPLLRFGTSAAFAGLLLAVAVVVVAAGRQGKTSAPARVPNGA